MTCNTPEKPKKDHAKSGGNSPMPKVVNTLLDDDSGGNSPTPPTPPKPPKG